MDNLVKVEQMNEIDKICRTCLCYDTNLKSLFNECDSDNNGISYAKMLAACSKYPVVEDDDFPNNICNKCLKDIKFTYEFKLSCEKSYETLKSIICHRTTETETEPEPEPETETGFGSFKNHHQKSDAQDDADVAVVYLDSNLTVLSARRSSDRNTQDDNDMHIKDDVIYIENVRDAFTCDICMKVYEDEEQFKMHIIDGHINGDNLNSECEIITPDQPTVVAYSCKRCKMHFDNDTEVENHSCNKIGDSIFLTVDLLKQSARQSKRNDDNYESDSDYMDVMRLSDQSNDDQSEDDDKSVSQNNNTTKTDTIPNGNKKTNKNQKVRRKYRKHKPPKVHKCEICDKVFSRATHLKRHALTHSEHKPFACNICEKGFTRQDHLSLHMHNHSEMKPHKCDQCNRGFIRGDQLRKHKETRHGAKPPTQKTEICEICKKAFTTPKYLQIHMRTHTDRIWNCKYCSEKFDSKKELQNHIKKHTNEKPYLCSECGLRFVRNDYLVIHMRRHKGEKPYKCKFCGKGFPRATDLTVHERYHTGEKTHLCTICGKGFQRAYNLLVHTRVHTGERPYQCPHCSKCFAQGNDLKAHVRRHTGERFKCEICGDGFIQGYHLTQHKRVVHGIDMKSHIRRVEKFTTPIEQEQQMKAIKEASKQNKNDNNLLTIIDKKHFQISESSEDIKISPSAIDEQNNDKLQQCIDSGMYQSNNSVQDIFSQTETKFKIEPQFD